MSLEIDFFLALVVFLFGIGCFRYSKKLLIKAFDNRLSGSNLYVTQGFVTIFLEILFFMVVPLIFLSLRFDSLMKAMTIMGFNLSSLPWLLIGVICGVIFGVFDTKMTLRFGGGISNFTEEIGSWDKRQIRLYFFIFVFQSLLYSLPEEVLYRGFLQSQLNMLFGSISSLLLVTAVFSIHPHTKLRWSKSELLRALPTAFILCLLYFLSRSLMAPIISHWLTNFLSVFLVFKKKKDKNLIEQNRTKLVWV